MRLVPSTAPMREPTTAHACSGPVLEARRSRTKGTIAACAMNNPARSSTATMAVAYATGKRPRREGREALVVWPLENASRLRRLARSSRASDVGGDCSCSSRCFSPSSCLGVRVSAMPPEPKEARPSTTAPAAIRLAGTSESAQVNTSAPKCRR